LADRDQLPVAAAVHPADCAGEQRVGSGGVGGEAAAEQRDQRCGVHGLRPYRRGSVSCPELVEGPSCPEPVEGPRVVRSDASARGALALRRGLWRSAGALALRRGAWGVSATAASTSGSAQPRAK